MRNYTMLDLYSCPSCKQMILTVQPGPGQLVCCGKPMEHLDEKSADAGKEKHLPVIENIPGGIRVKIGGVPHPMEKDHYIRWVEVIGDDFLYTLTFRPGDAPVREISLAGPNPLSRVRKVRIYCNLHGAWSVRP
jgi:superoxide reductase